MATCTRPLFRPRQVDGHDIVPHLQRQIIEIDEGDRDVVSGVIDQNIEPTPNQSRKALSCLTSQITKYLIAFNGFHIRCADIECSVRMLRMPTSADE